MPPISLFTSSTLAIVAAGSMAVAQGPFYAVTDLGALTGVPMDSANLINASGEIVGSHGFTALRYAPATGAVTQLQVPWGGSFRPKAINDSGQVAGEAGTPSAGGGVGFALFTPGVGWQDLGVLTPGSPPAGALEDINNHGEVVGMVRISVTLGEAFHWSQATGIRSLTPGVDGWFQGLNDLGQGYGRVNNQWHYLDSGTLIPLSFRPEAIGAAGLVGGTTTSPQSLVQYRYGSPPRMQTFPIPVQPNTSYAVAAVNESGLMVGTWNFRLLGTVRNGAFLFDPALGYVEGAALDARIVTPGWSIDSLNDINEAGSIVGVGHTTANPIRRAIRLDPSGPPARATTFGTGCYDGVATFFEFFGSGAFDLAGTTTTVNSVRLTRSALGYEVGPGTNAWHTPTSPNLVLTDEAVSHPIALPFPFSHLGGTTTVVRMAANGFLWLNGTATWPSPSPGENELVQLWPRLAPMWCDLDPGAGGTTHHDVDAANNAVYFTWQQVPERGRPGTRCTFQVALFGDGSAEFRWREIENLAGAAFFKLVGYSSGNGARLPSVRDLSTSLPFQLMPDSNPLRMVPQNPPRLGQLHVETIADIPPGATLSIVFLGFTALPNGIDLASIGMQGCRQYLVPSAEFAVTSSGSSVNWSQTVPTDQALVGQHALLQAATLAPGVNPLGVVTSNAVDLALGM